MSKRIVKCPDCKREIVTEQDDEFQCRKCYGRFPVKENII